MEIGTEAAQFPEKEYINGIFIAVLLLSPQVNLMVKYNIHNYHLFSTNLLGNTFFYFFWEGGGVTPPPTPTSFYKHVYGRLFQLRLLIG
jgi:hypothetical protein